MKSVKDSEKHKSEVLELVNSTMEQEWSNLGIDKPDNHDAICEFITEDVIETADPVEYHSGDVLIGFRRFIESKTN